MSKPLLPYLSPTSINTYLTNVEEFFLRYIVNVPRTPQERPMAIGSAFDSCIKAYLVSWSSPEGYNRERHTELYQEYFEKEVEEQHRDWAYTRGIVVFNMYRETGALDALLNDVVPGTLEALGKVRCDIDGVPLLGKPDVSWVSKMHGCKVVDDWKCNGACSQHNKSPNPGYVDIFPSRAMHPACDLVDGVNQLDMHPYYSLQLCVYKLLTGAEIVGINQLVFGASSNPDVFGNLRVALHRHRVSPDLEASVRRTAVELWEHVTSYVQGGPFGSIDAERCALLQKQADLFNDPVERFLSGR